MSTPDPADLVIVANRLPVDRITNPDGSPGWRGSPGGLVTAIEPIMRANSGIWVGWPGGTETGLEPFEHDGMTLEPVALSAQEVEGFYEGLSNATIWPLYHDLVAKPEFHREWWDSYVDVNRRFAERAAARAAKDATVWVQDYQLQLVPQLLRELRPDLRIGFFLHIPFPPAELFQQLPWRRQLLEGLLGADLVGFQLPGGASNFRRLCRRLLGLPYKGNEIFLDDRIVTTQAFPISVDFAQLDSLVREPHIVARAKEIRMELGDPEHVLLGVDRLDYTKGIGHRLKAFGELLGEGRIDVEKVTLVQVASPSRERVETYRQLRDEIELTVGRINGDYATLGHTAVAYFHHGYPKEEMVALYLAADVMLVTALRDGMNLVAKEYVATRVDEDGVLVLSEFAGASDELRQALLINPHDIEGLKDSIVQAVAMPKRDRVRRMRVLRKKVLTNDVARWSASFLEALTRSAHGDHPLQNPPVNRR